MKLKMTYTFKSNEHLFVFIRMLQNFEIELWLSMPCPKNYLGEGKVGRQGRGGREILILI